MGSATSDHQCIQRVGGWQEWEAGKPWAQQVSPTVELTNPNQFHARLRLQGCGGEPRGLGGTHTPTNS